MVGRVLGHLVEHLADGLGLAAGEGIGGVAPGTAQRAAGEADEHRRQADPGGFALDGIEDFADLEGQLTVILHHDGDFLCLRLTSSSAGLWRIGRRDCPGTWPRAGRGSGWPPCGRRVPAGSWRWSAGHLGPWHGQAICSAPPARR
ncbi:hypothetical protein SDC9_205449 [bioreactor metagenome]|uniref:Uncharacterized protein n=1 Tax=bioreactor metagenome TaxID=1076179 RepID=A0A645J237_9ZZZZ